MLETLLSLKALLAGGALVLFLTGERLWPAVDSPLLLRLGRARRAAWCRLARNVTLFGINLALSPLVVLPITVWATGFQLGLRPGWWHGWQGLLLDLVLLDFDLLVASGDARDLLALALSPGPSPGRAVRQHERRAVPFRRGGAVGTARAALIILVDVPLASRSCCSRPCC